MYPLRVCFQGWKIPSN